MIALTYDSNTKILDLITDHYSVLANTETYDISIKIDEQIIPIDQTSITETIFQISTLVDTELLDYHIDLIKAYRNKFKYDMIFVNQHDLESKLCMRRGRNSIERVYIEDGKLLKYIHFNVGTMQYFVDDSFSTYLTDNIDDNDLIDVCMLARIKYALYS
ncbi:hypothetical protein OGY35_23780 [Citrobacter sp. Ct235]|uniref:hypothetical protein n=1 Tax=Citrobacter sp. Ct235 TaxID=2985157 RepID=UPI002576B4EC|nr:hypothetical protein [Citrobacter sp. Ct235]MDM2738376.1 hypothetical protein [Citrobacter sp. Ct235]